MQPITSYPPRPPVRGAGAWLEILRDRFADPRVRVGAVLLVAGIAGYFWYQVGQDQAAAALPGAPAAATAKAPRAGSGPTTTTLPPVLVHVAGAVVHPGLVRVATGARVADAIDAAGGGLADADLDRLNLAAKVVDGQRIPVAKVGDPATNGGVDPSTAGGGIGVDGTTTAGAEPVNLNTATSTELETLPGIGPSFAAAIIRERERRGGFTSIDQLRDVRGIGEKRFADLKPLVSV